MLACHRHPALSDFDNILRGGLSHITNCTLSEIQWIQASLPITDGGLGLRRASQLALSAFLASAAGTANLQSAILPGVEESVDRELQCAGLEWSTLHNVPHPSGACAALQRAWDAPSIVNDKALVLAGATSQIDKARILALSVQHSSDWLFALPISSCGLRLDDEAIRVAVGLRLGVELCERHVCPCGAEVDTRGLHGLSCRRSAGRATRHQQMNDFIYRALRNADVPAVKEPSGLIRSDGKRPDGLTLIPWQGGRCLTWDVTVTDPLAASYVSASSSVAGAAAEAAATRKRAKYSSIAATHIFVPIAAETLGPLCAEAYTFLKEIGRRLTIRTGERKETSFLFQRLSVLIQRFNAVAFRGSFVEETEG